MQEVVLVVHLLITLALIGVVLVQKSEGGGLGVGGGTMGGFMTARGSANLLTRTTAILAALFFCTSLILAILAGTDGNQKSIFDQVPAPGTQAPATPAEPAKPAVPVGQ
ncbi:preprotein translocase subunit SecG [Niveispirillum lacus]|uniref:Protein-export membrane protein SecG n=1 Tax=Niveispirillum lacus TaxID=1981099 RepID=A0A255YUF0_9PROT|nr:preprotein translocase subunit SecG [Niveispirillum lacus]OYQ32857.1 preprotein translocase subunit SecG [Niveispirillum lacus]